MTLLTIKIEKIGLKDAGQCIDPYMTVSVKGTAILLEQLRVPQQRTSVKMSVIYTVCNVYVNCKEQERHCITSIAGLCNAEKTHSACTQCTVLKVAIISADLNGVDLNPVQDTPVASRKEDTYIHFNIDIEIQKHIEKLPKGEQSCTPSTLF